ncbi:MAG: tRNA1(Val) (adenine(37)-N6)-methyltransferase [Christensenellales bacterium]|jgi:tRNA1Val (adenine37-N6)-methyltransferase
MIRGKVELDTGDRIEDLQNGYHIIQNPAYFSFGTDAVLLGSFAAVRMGERVVDFGTGCGILPILLCAKTKGIHVTGIEIQHGLVRMAQRSVALNALEDSIRIVFGDIKDICNIVSYGVDVVVANPPYGKINAGKISGSPQVDIAKREVKCTLNEIVKSASRILRTGGRFYLIYTTDRFAELMECMRAHAVEPKRIMMVAQQQDKAPNFMLVEGRKGARTGVKFLPTLIVYEPDGTYTKQTKKIYHIEEDDVCCTSLQHR